MHLTLFCTLHTAYCTLHTAHCTLYTAHCTLHTANWTLYTAHCTLHTALCTLHTAHRTSLYTLEWAPASIYLYITFYNVMSASTIFKISALNWAAPVILVHYTSLFYNALHCTGSLWTSLVFRLLGWEWIPRLSWPSIIMSSQGNLLYHTTLYFTVQ